MPGVAAEETEPFPCGIQKKTDLFLARVKPFCSKFLCSLSWLQRKPAWEREGVTQTPRQPQGSACSSPGCRERRPCSQITNPAEGRHMGTRPHQETCWFGHVAAAPQASFTALPSFVLLPLQATGIGILV